MKKLLTLMAVVVVAMAANAKAILSGPANGIISINVENEGDLASFDFTSLSNEQKACTSFNIKGNIGQTDLIALSQNFIVKTLDFTDASNIDGTWVLTDGQYDYKTTLETFIFPKYLTTVDGQWINQTSVKNIIIPNGIGNGSDNVEVTGFTCMSHLETLVVGTGVTTIADGAFQEVMNLKVLDIRPGVKTIGNNAFNKCPILDLVLPEGLETIGNNAFCKAKVTSLHLPYTLKTISSNAFMDCDNLDVVIIPSNVEYVGPMAFKGKSITDVYVLGENTKAAINAFDPGNTYDYVTYTPNGEVDRTDWTGRENLHPAILHYPEAVREKYLNGRLLNPQSYPDYFREGVKYPVTYQDWGNDTENSNFDYHGWQEFMLTEIITDDEIFIVDNILDDTWYTMCFPFDLTVSQLYTAFGDFTEVCEFVKAEVSDGANGVKSVDFQFKRWVGKDKNANEIVTYANKPYMIHPNLGVKTGQTISRRVVIAGINKLKVENQTPWTSDNYKTGEDGDYIFVGNYKKQAIPQYAYFLGCKNGEVKFLKQLAVADQDRTTGIWKPYTSVIMTGAMFDEDTSFWTCSNDGINKTSTVINAKITDIYDTGEATNAISEIQNNENVQAINDNVIRNINGQIVRRGTTSTEGLPKGLYIVNGKKYLVR